MKTFYAHLVETEIIERELDSLDLTTEEKNDLMHHVHTSVHYKVLDVVLSDLSEEDKKTFLEHLKKENHEDLWSHLFAHTKDIEEQIKKVGNSLVSEFAIDIKMIKERHKK